MSWPASFLVALGIAVVIVAVAIVAGAIADRFGEAWGAAWCVVAAAAAYAALSPLAEITPAEGPVDVRPVEVKCAHPPGGPQPYWMRCGEVR